MSQSIRPLLDILPGANKNIISIGSKYPDVIIKILDQSLIDEDTVVLENGDVWRYFDHESSIFNHPALANKNVFIQTLGYTNTKVNDIHFKISYPVFYWLREINNTNFIPLETNLSYGFSCLNNRAAIHRLLLGYEFYNNNLLDKILFGQNILELEYASQADCFNFANWQDYKKLLPIKHPSEIGVRNFRGSQNYKIPTHPAHTNCYCNIVTETDCEEYPYKRNINLPVITEKSYKPLMAKQIPIMLAARGHIAYFKGLGFEMFDDLMPTNYDNMQVPEKVNAIVGLVQKGKEFIKDYYFNHLKEIQHNYELINSDLVEKLILQRIYDLVNT